MLSQDEKTALLAKLQTDNADVPLGYEDEPFFVVFRAPSPASAAQLVAGVSSNKSNVLAVTRNYVLQNLLYPTRDEAAAGFGKYALYASNLSAKISVLGGADAEGVSVKKL